MPRVTCHGLLNRKDVAIAMQKVDFLLNIGNKASIQLPSKCVDYWASAKPILQYRYAENDLFDAFFDHYPDYHILPHQLDADTKARYLYQFLTKKEVFFVKNIIQNKLNPYSTAVIAAEYLRLSASLVH